jgi:hypothetical protein
VSVVNVNPEASNVPVTGGPSLFKVTRTSRGMAACSGPSFASASDETASRKTPAQRCGMVRSIAVPSNDQDDAIVGGGRDGDNC